MMDETRKKELESVVNDSGLFNPFHYPRGWEPEQKTIVIFCGNLNEEERGYVAENIIKRTGWGEGRKVIIVGGRNNFDDSYRNCFTIDIGYFLDVARKEGRVS
ncbi:MAG: hypothetical protein N3D20_01515 [Candidatus Pacearchaeota archaeon]|nr:hypothetical protein [Candidatus Pacearchaeota archaeon]